MFYVYALYNKDKDWIYVGTTSDLKRRFQEHQASQVSATKGRLPLKLVFYEAFSSNSDARRDELFYKTGYGKEVLKEKIKGSLI